MKIPVDRYGNPKVEPKPKAWMSHHKCKNGYIVRLKLDNGYKAYRAAWAADLDTPDQTDIRQIELWEDYYDYFNREQQQQPTPFTPAMPGSPRRLTYISSTRDDPVRDGRDLAADEEWDYRTARTTGRGVKVSGDAEDKEIADLRRQGLLYDDDEEGVDLELGDVVRDRPVYTVRHVAGRGTREKGVPDRGGVELTGEEEEVRQGETDMLFVPEGEFESWAEFAERNGFDVVMVDDAVSVAESWVEVNERG